jgi:peptide/nickel transport system permease protein
VARFIAARVAQGVIVIFGAVAISFFLVNLSGNAVDALGTGVNAAARVQLAHEYGLDRPLLTRFLDCVVGVAHGSFGNSFRSTTPAMSLVLDGLPYTLTLVLGTLLVTCAVAMPLAVLSVMRRGSPLDRLLRRTFMVVQGLPEFFLAVLLVLAFAVQMHALPSFGVDGPTSYILPIAALSLPLISTLTRLLRSQLIDIMGREFITALRARGLTQREIVFGHAARNAAPAMLTYLALQSGWLVGGTIIVEFIFGIPGIGQLAVTAAGNHDLSVIQAVVVTVATMYVLLNLLADVAVYRLDPRVRAAAA